MCERGYLDLLGEGPVVVERQSNQSPIVDAFHRNTIQSARHCGTAEIVPNAMVIAVGDADRTVRELVGIEWIRNNTKLIGGEDHIKRCEYCLELHRHGPIPLRPEIEGGTP